MSLAPVQRLPAPAATKSALEVDYFVVLDFEATCERNKATQQPQEIIEVPSVLLDSRSLQQVAEVQLYVRPVARPTLSEFCTELTGITQETVANAPVFIEAMSVYLNWLWQHKLSNSLTTDPQLKTFAFVTVSDWDLGTLLPNQQRLTPLHPHHHVGYVDFDRWVDLKRVFARCMGEGKTSMVDMLNRLELPLQGRQHSGLDDCRNTARILAALLGTHGPKCVWITTQLRKNAVDTGSAASRKFVNLLDQTQ